MQLLQLQFPTFQIFPFELWLGSQKHSCCLDALIQTQIDAIKYKLMCQHQSTKENSDAREVLLHQEDGNKWQL